MKKTIILGSTSPRRKEILSILDIPFQIIASSYEEDMSLQSTMNPEELAMFLSRGKGESIKDELTDKELIIISADTFVVYNNKCLGKPYTKEKQRLLLKEFSGKRCDIITGIYIYDGYRGFSYNEAIISKLYFKDLDEKLIDRYINTEEGLDRAGGFAVQEKGNVLIDRIEGDRYNIVGLPLSRIFQILQECKAL